jgi:hypothetical protein
MQINISIAHMASIRDVLSQGTVTGSHGKQRKDLSCTLWYSQAIMTRSALNWSHVQKIKVKWLMIKEHNRRTFKMLAWSLQSRDKNNGSSNLSIDLFIFPSFKYAHARQIGVHQVPDRCWCFRTKKSGRYSQRQNMRFWPCCSPSMATRVPPSFCAKALLLMELRKEPVVIFSWATKWRL